MHLVFLLEVHIVLSYAFQCKFFHEIHLLGIFDIFVFEVQDGNGEGGGKEHQLAIQVAVFDYALDNGLEIDRKQLIGLVKHQSLCIV